MLMMTHKSDIDHILHDLEQIEYSNYDTNTELTTIEQDKMLAKEVIDDFLTLLNSLEDEEFEHAGKIYDGKTIEDMCMISYYMCKYGHQSLFDMTMTLEEASMKCAEAIDCNVEALINMKNMYEDYFVNTYNGRMEDLAITNDMLMVMKVSDSMTHAEMRLACKRIIGFWN